MTLIDYPDIPRWAQALASIIPLSALIEFVDVKTSIHVEELRGRSVPFWCWPIPPAGARVLLSNERTASDCLLDQPSRSQGLSCIDGRAGNQYPCSAPTTTRLWADHQKTSITIENNYPTMDNDGRREQVLRAFQVREEKKGEELAAGQNGEELASDQNGEMLALGQEDVEKLASAQTSEIPTRGPNKEVAKKTGIVQNFTTFSRSHRPRYIVLWCVGSILWVGLVIVALMGGLYIAGTYLLLMPLTNIVVGYTHGTSPREPVIRSQNGAFPRLIIAAGSENAPFWYAFDGHQTLLNGLLNISLKRTQTLPARPLGLVLLRVLILGQWAMVLASCAREGWDAFIVSIWTILCIFMNAYGYPVHTAAKDWLKRDCKLKVKVVETKVSSRYALLFALAVINPDTREDKTDWMDSIVKDDIERRYMWATMIIYARKQNAIGDDDDVAEDQPLDDEEVWFNSKEGEDTVKITKADIQNKWWWDYMVEGVGIGKKVRHELRNEGGDVIHIYDKEKATVQNTSIPKTTA
jgi:hypothetical protein